MKYIFETLPDGKSAALGPILGAALSRYMDDEVKDIIPYLLGG